MDYKFEGKVALVTGAGSGIGRASALAFARAGARVVIDDISEEGGEKTLRMITEAGGEAIFVKADVSRAVKVTRLIDETIEKFGRLDYAHNNAGINPPRGALTTDCTEDEWDAIINTNLKGVWLCMKQEIIQMLKQGSGAIVNTASMRGVTGNQRRTAYVASKHGVVGITKTAALEYATAGIRVNAVCPGIIRTPMTEGAMGADPQAEARYNALEPIGRLGVPEEIAESVIWLCSDAASFVTGHAMLVDGGYTAQ